MEQDHDAPANDGVDGRPDWWHKPDEIQQWNATTEAVRQDVVQQETGRNRGRGRGRGRARGRGGHRNGHNDFRAQHNDRERGGGPSNASIDGAQLLIMTNHSTDKIRQASRSRWLDPQ